MKKIGIFICALILLFVFCACGAGNLQAATSSDNSAASSVLTEADVEDSLDGLMEYLLSNGIISGEKTEMEAKFIGAEAGYKYAFSSDTTVITVELYAFDQAALDDTAKTVIQSVKENGYFTLLETQVEATLSNNEKYLMIYVMNKENEEVLEQKEQAITAFKNFKNA